MRVLTNEDVESVLGLEDCMDALETAYRELAVGRGANRPRNHSYLPVRHDGMSDCQYRFKSQEGGTEGGGVWALRLTSEMIGSEVVQGVKRRRYIPAAPGGMYCGLVLLFSTTSLEPLAILQDSYIQKLRCSATSALGIKLLSKSDVRIAGLFGTGWQAQSHLQYMALVRPSLREIRVYSPVAEDREAFARTWTGKLGPAVVAVAHPKDAVADSELVVCATNTFDPCFDGSWLKPGSHVASITHPDANTVRRELDDVVYDRASVIAVLSREQIRHDNQIDIMGPVERGLKRFEELIELGDLLSGKVDGRAGPDEITVFANNTGMGLQFAAAGARALKLAEHRGLGRDIPGEWFLQATPP